MIPKGEPIELSAEQVDNLRKMWENGCPTYQMNDGSRTRDGMQACWFCNEIEPHWSQNKGLEHTADCPWLTLEDLFANKT